MRTISLAILLAAVLLGLSLPKAGAGGERIRVEVSFRETVTSSRDTALGNGAVIVTRRGPVRGALGLDAESRTIRSSRSSGIFTLVQDGGTSRLSVATRVPYHDVVWLRDYATGAGYLAEEIVLEDVGTSLRVGATRLADGRIRVDLVPSVSWFAPDGSSAIDFTNAASEVIVSPGEEVTIGGSTRDLHEITRRILGISRTRESGESSIVLKATVE